MQHVTRAFSALLVVALAMAFLPATSAFAITDTTGPTTSAVAVVPNPMSLSLPVTVTATVDDTNTGGSNIASAVFTVNGSDPVDMTGAFNTGPMITVTGTFTPTLQGDNTICVQGTDTAGNTGLAACEIFTAQSIYTFKGFMPPVKMAGNKAQAGQTVPLKWKLTMTADGKPVSDPTAFVGVMSYSVDCTTLVGDSTTAVAEKGPGKGKAAVARYLGGGKWIFNWKTPKTYAASCRMMFVEFSDGSMSPSVLYRFR
jgi:hypothetical protein